MGLSEATLRTWERRYAVVNPPRTQAGYRLYGPPELHALTAMRRLVDAGWAPANAARAILQGEAPGEQEAEDATPDVGSPALEEFLSAAAAMDPLGIVASLDKGMALGSFEHAVDTWLCPALRALGEGWAGGEIDVAGEHMASHHVLRRLSAAFDAAGSRARGPRVVVGLPAGSRHELGALAFATAVRRLGCDVLYVGADVPVQSWVAAVEGHRADAAVLGVVSPEDRASATGTVRRLRQRDPDLLIAVGGASSRSLTKETHELPEGIGAAADRLDVLLAG